MTKDQFLHGVNNNDVDHRVLLWEAMQLTKGKVVEFGSGHGSTPFIREYCQTAGRDFESYDNHPGWAQATGATLVKNWEELNIQDPDVLFIDHAPGERRKEDIEKYMFLAKILVIHDTEPPADHGYQCRQHFPRFKYCVEVKTNGAWATMCSNFIDLSGCIGKSWEQFVISQFTS